MPAVLSRDKVGFFRKAVIAVMSFAVPTEILKSKCAIKLYMEVIESSPLIHSLKENYNII